MSWYFKVMYALNTRRAQRRSKLQARDFHSFYISSWYTWLRILPSGLSLYSQTVQLPVFP